ncbi:MAG: YitT family protein [candidate division WOR-3 bacterium]
MRRSIREQALGVVWLTSGSAVAALAYNLFLIPHQIVPGGAGGVAMILHHFFQTPVGLIVILLNVPVFFLGIQTLGKTYGLKSLVGMALTALFIDLGSYWLHLRPATDNPVLACIFGGIMLGAGLGLVFRGGGSTGGSDIIGMAVNRQTNLSTGTAILVVDCAVITAAGLAFGSFELALYGYLNLYLQTRAIDLVLEGLSYTRALLVVTSSARDVAGAITERLNRGATIFPATGAYSEQAREMVFSVMSRREVAIARDLVRSIDPKAFVVISDVYEVLGEGFRPRVQ